MRIPIDKDENGFVHWIGLDEPDYPLVSHPDNSGRQVDTMTMIAHHNEHPEAREAGGWHVVSNITTDGTRKTRWDLLVEACNHAEAPAHIRALGLRK